MPSQQMGPRPMNMGFGRGSPFFSGNPYGGFGGGMPQNLGGGVPPQTPTPPTKNYGPVGDMLGSAQNQVNPQQPQIQTQTVPPMTSQIPSGYTPPTAIACGTPMGGGATGVGRGKGRTGPGTSGGFSGGFPSQPQPMTMNIAQPMGPM